MNVWKLGALLALVACLCGALVHPAAAQSTPIDVDWDTYWG